MTESRTAETLINKRGEIARSIDSYEKKLAQARADLAHIDAAIAIFQTSDHSVAVTPYVDIHRLFKRGEMVSICREALKTGPKNTRELSALILEAKGLDAGDKVLAKAVSYKLIHALRIQARTGKIVGIGRYKAARIWRLPETFVKFGRESRSNMTITQQEDRKSYAALRRRWACERCGEKPLAEEMTTYFETGLCGWCDHMVEKND